MKKKVLALFTLIITICSIFALTACGDSSGDGSIDSGQSSVSTTVTVEQWTKAFKLSNVKNYSYECVTSYSTSYTGRIESKLQVKKDNGISYQYGTMKMRGMSILVESYIYKENDKWYSATKQKLPNTEQDHISRIEISENLANNDLDVVIKNSLSQVFNITRGYTLYSENFENAVYDEKTNEYVITEVGIGGNGVEKTVISKIAFKNNEIARLTVLVEGEEFVKISNVKFGGTKISIPDWAMKK